MTAEVPPNLQAETEAQYDATVRADIELFRSFAEKYMAGGLTDDEFRVQRLRRGVYGQRQAGVQMIRTKVPGGMMTAAATLSSSSRLSRRTPCVARPAERMVLVSMRMILPY